MKGGPALLGGILLLTTRDLKIPKLHTHAKVYLGQHFWIPFHVTSSVCLCVGYKIETLPQISNSGFRVWK